MNILARKSLLDVLRRKDRALLAILGIGIGVAGLTAVNQAAAQIGDAFFYATDAAAVPNVSCIVDLLPASVATAIQRMPEVASFQLRAIYLTRWYLANAADAPVMAIYGYDEFDGLRLGAFQLTQGRLPGAGEIVLDINDQALQPEALGPGDAITVDAPDGQRVSLRVSGMARTNGLAVWHIPPAPIGYMSAPALQQLAQNATGPVLNHLPRGTQILVRTREAVAASQTYGAIATLLNKAGVPIQPFSGTVSLSNAADTQLGVAGLLAIMQLLVGLTLLLGCVLIFNMVSALLAEQVWIIGTLKALGATRARIVGSYLLTVAIYGAAGTALGLALGWLAGHQLATSLAANAQIQVSNTTLATSVGGWTLAPWVIGLGVLAGLVAPMLSALWPLWGATRITVREATAGYGLRNASRASLRGHERQWLPPLIWLGVSSPLRRPGRSALALLALALSAGVFLAVQIANDSLRANLTQLSGMFASDFRVDLAASVGQTVPAGAALKALAALPNVAQVEPIDPQLIAIRGRELELNGLAADTRLYKPSLVAGRWLRPDDVSALVINDFAAQRLGLHPGDRAAVQVDTAVAAPGRTAPAADWTIVGIVHEVADVSAGANPAGRLGEAFTTLDDLNTLRRAPAGSAERLWLQATDRSPQALASLQTQIDQALRGLGLDNASALAIQADYAQVSDLQVSTYLLLDTTALLVALLALFGLIHALAAAVLERRLEIGILRALGATGWRVGLVFCVEALAFAGLAGCLGVALGIPGGAAIVSLLNQFMRAIDVDFSLWRLPAMLSVVCLAAVVASVGPALGAARLRVRAILRYE